MWIEHTKAQQDTAGHYYVLDAPVCVLTQLYYYKVIVYTKMQNSKENKK